MSADSAQPASPREAPRLQLSADGGPDSRWFEQVASTQGAASDRWIGWRLRALVLVALAGSMGLFLLLRSWAVTPYLDTVWRSHDNGLELVAAADPRLHAMVGRVLRRIDADGLDALPAQPQLLHHSPRWTVDDAERQQMLLQQRALSQMVALPEVRLHFGGAEAPLSLRPVPRGFAGFGLQFWVLCALALVVYLAAAAVALSRPVMGNLLYATIALSQSANLVLMAAETLGGLGLPAGLVGLILPARVACDMVAGGAVLHVCATHRQATTGGLALSMAGWMVAMAMIVATVLRPPPGLWWLTQWALIGFGALAIATLTWSQHVQPHPFTVMLRRLGLALALTLMLLTLGVAAARHGTETQYIVASVGSVIWYVFFASLLLLVPFLSRSHLVMREFAMLAGISTVATSLDLLFAAVFALGQFASLTLSLFLSLGIYAGARQWIMTQLAGSPVPSAERMFDSLYRVVRDIESEPDKATEHLARLMQELYDPIEIALAPRRLARTRVAGDGSLLAVPLPSWPGDGQSAPGVLLLRHARRGRRMFTQEDARLSDRVLEQLSRAVAYDRAVEQGRSEERMRIAQDLHDDIGARLLTLMYKAQTPEMEEYVRHTLQDLKTLTRGLAASSHRLSHSAAEWKADVAQRLSPAHCDLGWSFSIDRDINLSVVQWSALTRVIRELVNNIIAHAGASRVDIAGQYERGRLTLTVTDDGNGRAPQEWAAGLGLGGVRKRVKLLGGQVAWKEIAPRGIVCEVRIPQLGETA